MSDNDDDDDPHPCAFGVRCVVESAIDEGFIRVYYVCRGTRQHVRKYLSRRTQSRPLLPSMKRISKVFNCDLKTQPLDTLYLYLPCAAVAVDDAWKRLKNSLPDPGLVLSASSLYRVRGAPDYLISFRKSDESCIDCDDKTFHRIVNEMSGLFF